MTRPIRVRFAPSPTGTLHVGNARTALFNHLYAKHHKGTMVLRVEDTDQERSTGESERTILEDLTWLGIEWQEGPDKGGAFGPYRQSERLDIYNQYLDQMLTTGRVYRCFCTKEDMDKTRAEQRMRKEQPRYPNTCRQLSADEAEQRNAAGEANVLRFKIEEPMVQFNDGVRGKVIKETKDLGGDFVIRKTDGFATYNFAVVVDDYLMQISHILRGEDHLVNTVKQFLVFDALGWERPATLHLSMILGPDKAKLSKRHGSTTVEEFRNAGYLPAAVVNYMAMLGWNSGDEQEIYTAEELEAAFSDNRLVKSAAVFDHLKLLWMNGQHLRKLEVDKFVGIAEKRLTEIGGLPDFWPKDSWFERIGFLQDSIQKLDDLPAFWSIFNSADIDWDHKDSRKIFRMDTAEAVYGELFKIADEADSLPDFDTIVEQIAEATEAKGRKLYQPLRVAYTGRPHGPDIHTLSHWIPESNIRQRISQIKEKEPWQTES